MACRIILMLLIPLFSYYRFSTEVRRPRRPDARQRPAIQIFNFIFVHIIMNKTIFRIINNSLFISSQWTRFQNLICLLWINVIYRRQHICILFVHHGQYIRFCLSVVDKCYPMYQDNFANNFAFPTIIITTDEEEELFLGVDEHTFVFEII